MEAWTSTLRPMKQLKPPTALRKVEPAAVVTKRKRSLGKTNFSGGPIASPKKSRLDVKRSSIEKTSKYRTLLSSHIKTAVNVRGSLPGRRTSIPVIQRKCDPDEAVIISPALSRQGIYERLQALEIRVQENSELAQNRVKELLTRNDALVDETDHLRSLLQEKIEEIRALRENETKTAKRLQDGASVIEQLEARLSDKSKACVDFEEKCETLKAELSIAKRMAESRNSESQMLRNLLSIEQDETKLLDEKLISVEAENILIHSKLRRSQARFHELQNSMLEAQGNIQVFARIRPSSRGAIADNEILKRQYHSIVVEKPSSKTARSNQLSFKFDKVFGGESCQSDIFDEIEPFVSSAVDGYNVCIFAYGQTGTGKTHTMEGAMESLEVQVDDIPEMGIVPLAFVKVLELVDEQSDTEIEFSLEASFIEIYNETVYDLLDGSRKRRVRLSTDPRRSEAVVAENVHSVQIKSVDQILDVLEKARRQRSVSVTKSNGRSSRSHCVYQLKITSKARDDQTVRSNVLNLIDLAGSECAKECLVDGARLTETKNINSSLTALLSVYSSLGSKASHVPYRNSKLTHLLSSALSSDSRTLFLVHLSPEGEHVNESVNSLKIAQKFRELHIESRT